MAQDGARTRGLFPHLTPDQLADPIRMHGIMREIASSGGRPEAAEDPRTLIRWFGLIRRSLRVAKNPAGCFRSLWRSRRWSWISQEDEDGARRDIAAALYGQEIKRRGQRDPIAEVHGEYDQREPSPPSSAPPS